MEFEILTHAWLPHLLFSVAYLAILFFATDKRDSLGFALVVAFCITLGLRNVESMYTFSDPIVFANILSYPADIKDLLVGADYAVFSLLHPITGNHFDLATCFFLLHLLYIPPIYLLYRMLRGLRGVFFLLAGWMLFVNSGLLLLANFFRQGICAFFFLAILVSFCVFRKNDAFKVIGLLVLPFLHLSSVLLIPSLLTCRMRRYLLISCGSLVVFCIAAHFAPGRIADSSDYFNNSDIDFQRKQLWIKIPTIYVMLTFSHFLSKRTKDLPVEAKSIERAAVGMLIPTAALYIVSASPVVGLRFLYYSYALAFLYLACAVACRKSDLLFKSTAIAFCLFGLVTWTYPTVAVLLVW